MDNSHFKVKAKFNLHELNIGDVINTSDFFTHDANGNAIQLEYISEEDKIAAYDVKPGIWKIIKTMQGFQLEPTSFVKDEILEELTSTKEVEDIIDTFFQNLHLYKEFGIEVPKRNILLYGDPGVGKTVALSRVVRKYVEDKKTAVVVWDTSAFDAYEVKTFIKHFKFINGVDKIILVVEDIGGIENKEYTVKSDSSLLSLLDNNEKTFKIPVMIIATTNYIANLEANLANRSGRFDDKIEVGYPNSEQRKKLLTFFAKEYATEEALKFIATDACAKFPPSSIREAYIRSRLRSKSLTEVIQIMVAEIKLFEKAFSKQRGIGL